MISLDATHQQTKQKQIKIDQIPAQVEDNVKNVDGRERKFRFNEEKNETHLIDEHRTSKSVEKKRRKKEIKRKRKLEKKQQKQLKKLRKKSEKTAKKSSGIDEKDGEKSNDNNVIVANVEVNDSDDKCQTASTTATENRNDEEIASGLKIDDDDDEQTTINYPSSVKEPLTVLSIVERTFVAQPSADDNGNYDELPLIKVDKTKITNPFDATEENGRAQFIVVETERELHAVDVHALSRASSDSIPFIDQSPCHQLNAVRTEAGDTLSARNDAADTKQTKIQHEKRDQSPQILYQSLKKSIDHHFERIEQLEHKLCQVCHEFLVATEAFKCLTCGIICHRMCTSEEVSCMN